MTFEHFRLGFNAIRPESDRLVRRARRYEIPSGIDVDCIDRACMSRKFERAEILFEIPDHNY